jgi:tetratricopeptide (TPR) repeat protein
MNGRKLTGIPDLSAGKKLLDQARDRLRESDPAGAMAPLGTYLADYPADPVGRYLAALACWKLGWLADGEAHLRRCLPEAAANGDVWRLFAALRRGVGADAGVMSAMRRSVVADPGNSSAIDGVAGLYIDGGELDMAAPWLTRALTVAPRGMARLARFVQACLEHGNERALASAAVIFARYSLGNEARLAETIAEGLLQGDVVADGVDPRKLASASPGGRLILRYLAAEPAAGASPDKALEWLRLAWSHSADLAEHAEIRFQAADLLTRNDRLPGALRQTMFCLVLEPSHPRAWSDHAGLKWRLDAHGDLDRYLRRAVQAMDASTTRDRAPIHRLRARYLRDKGRFAAAILEARRVTEMPDPTAEDFLVRATVEIAEGKKSEAAASLRGVIGRLGGDGAAMSQRSPIKTDTRAYCERSAARFALRGPSESVQLRTGSAAFPDLAYTAPAPFLACLNNALIMPHDFSIITDDNHFLVDRLTYVSETKRRSTVDFSYVSAGPEMELLHHPEEARATDAILLGGGGNFYHCIVDWFSRLGVIEGERELDNLPLVVASDMPATVIEFLGLLGINPERLDPMSTAPRSYRRLWVPSITQDRFGFAAPRHLSFLERAVFGRFRDPMARGARRLFVTRRDTTHRLLLNEDEVVAMLAARGFEIVEPQKLTMRAQIDLFAQAECVVGCFGAGLSGMLAAPRTARIIELTHRRAAHPMFAILAALREQLYRQILGPPVVSRSNLAMHSNFSIPIDSVRDALAELDLD